MRRSGVLTGIGNSAPEIMDGKSTGDKKLDMLVNACAKDCYETFFKGTKQDYEYVDAGATAFGFKFGIEPAYFGDNLKIIYFVLNKDMCGYETGHAFGYYGSGIRSTDRLYKDYKNSTKFTRFIDKWHPKLFANSSTNKRKA